MIWIDTQDAFEDAMKRVATQPKVAVDTSLGPRMSGLIRPSIVGPRELYESTRPVCQQAAPTVMTEETVAGSTTLPLATGWSSLEAVTNRSIRGVAVPLARQIPRWNVVVDGSRFG